MMTNYCTTSNNAGWATRDHEDALFTKTQYFEKEAGALAYASQKASQNHKEYYVYKAIKKVSPNLDVNVEEIK